MPLYTTLCPSCEKQETIWRRVDERDSLPDCCGLPVKRIITAPYIAPDFSSSYISPASGKVINSRAQQQEDLKRNGMILSEPGLRKDIERNKVSAQEKAFTPIAAAVDEKVRELVNSSKIES